MAGFFVLLVMPPRHHVPKGHVRGAPGAVVRPQAGHKGPHPWWLSLRGGHPPYVCVCVPLFYTPTLHAAIRALRGANGGDPVYTVS